MTTDSLDSHDIYTTVRTSWATRLTQPTEYGIADALGQDTTRQVLTRPAFAAVYLQAATVGVCDAILSRGHDHARTVIQQPRLPQPTVDDFDLTTEIPTVHQWIIDSLTGNNQQTEAAISHTLTTAPNPTDAALRHAIALLHVGSLAATPATRPADQPHTPGTTDGAAQALATLNANIPELRRLGGLPPAPEGSSPHGH